jgi:hypothetical protein
MTQFPEDTIFANGVSFYERNGTFQQTVAAPYDYAVLFLSRAKTLAQYYQYNYLTNVSLQTLHTGFVACSDLEYLPTYCSHMLAAYALAKELLAQAERLKCIYLYICCH